MCGRFSLTFSAEELSEVFQLDEIPPSFPPRYNVAPSQPIAAVLKTIDRPSRHFSLLRWGLIPSWSKDPAIGNRLINARAETVGEKPSFRTAFKRRRCLIPASGFYEWQKKEQGKQAYYFHLKENQPFAFAGLWETWQDIPTGTILTTAANQLSQPIHDRMPVILKPEDYDRWLDPTNQASEVLQSLLKPFPSEEMEIYPVSNKVNNPANDSPECVMTQV